MPRVLLFADFVFSMIEPSNQTDADNRRYRCASAPVSDRQRSVSG